MTRQVICYILLLSVFLVVESEGGISLSQSIDRTEMAYEETANFEIAISWDGSPGRYRFDKPLRLDADKLKVTKFSSSVSSTGSGEDEVTTKLFKYTLAPTLSGRGELFSLTVEYIGWPDSAVGSLSTDPLEIMIAQPIPKSKIGLSEEGYSTTLIVSLVFLLLLLGGGGIYFSKRRKDVQVVLSNRELFLDELNELKKLSGTDMKIFQTGLYKNMIRFLEEEYKIEIIGKPIDSILEIIEKTELSREIKDSFSNWLTRAEKEKFSPIASSPGETIRLESEIRQFFEKMK